MNSLKNFDETDREYSPALLMNQLDSGVKGHKVTAGHRGGEVIRDDTVCRGPSCSLFVC